MLLLRAMAGWGSWVFFTFRDAGRRDAVVPGKAIDGDAATEVAATRGVGCVIPEAPWSLELSDSGMRCHGRDHNENNPAISPGT